MAEQLRASIRACAWGRRSESTDLPVAHVDWQPDPGIRTSTRAAQDLLDDQLRERGFAFVEDGLGDESPPRQMNIGWHHMGTTRMSSSPALGVVDADCRVWGLDNLSRGRRVCVSHLR